MADFAAFKRNIDLRAYAGTHGWVVDRSGGIGRSTQMRHRDGSREIVVSQDTGAAWIYFRRAGGGGSIIDFCRQELDMDWHDTIAALAIASTTPLPPPPIQSFASGHRAISRQHWEPAQTGDHAYLLSRGICARTVALFEPSLHVGPGGAVQFPHSLAGGSGYEYRGWQARGFSAGGTKGLWCHVCDPLPTKIIVCESGIDCMSYAQLHALSAAVAYCSTAGTCGPRVINGLVELARQWKASIVAAVDADTAGDRLAAQIEHAAHAESVLVQRHSPEPYNDWNDALDANRDAALNQCIG